MDGTDLLQPIARNAARLGPHVRPHEALEQIVRDCVARIQASKAGIGAGSAEALHEARVALRRWRTALAVFKALQTEDGRRMAAELAWLAGETNDARDLDVLAPRLEGGGEALRQALEAARGAAYARVSRALRSERAGRLLWRGERRARRALVRDDDGPSARRLAARALTRHRRRLARRGERLARMGAAERHRFRVLAKKTRYVAELFGELFVHAGRQRRLGAELRRLQDALGELNDIHVGEGLAERISAEAGTAQAGFQAGLAAGRRAGEGQALLRKAKKAWAGVVDARRFW